MGRTLYEKVYDAHVVNELSGELPLLYIDRHLLHEVTSPQAFSGLREAGRKLRRPDLMLATMDHDISTQKATLDVCSPMAREQVTTLIRNCREFGVTLFGLGHPGQGIVHIVGPQTGFTLPGTTLVCGDSHTATHGAFGALAFGIGTSEVEHVMATQTLKQQRFKTMRIVCDGVLPKGVYAKDLILAIATPAAQAVAGATSDIPIVCTAITDFAASGLVKDNDAPGGNVTGTSDMNPVVDQIDLLHQLAPEAKKVGLLYCTAESNSKIQIELAAAELKKLGIEGVEYTASSSNEVQQVVESMMGKVDAIYTPTDNTIASAMTVIASIANEHKVPTVCGEVAHVEAGGLASLSINYEELGRRAGEMAVRILTEGAEPAAMPIESMGAAECDLVYNGRTAEALGIDVTSLVEDGATDVSAAE